MWGRTLLGVSLAALVAAPAAAWQAQSRANGLEAPHIQRLLLFAKEANEVTTQERLRERYRLFAGGTNFYYGLNPANRDRFAASGRALSRDTHRRFFDGILTSLKQGAATEKTVVLGVEPPQSADPYGFVSRHLYLVERLARELRAYQEDAEAVGKRLRIVIRYASEMNDDNPGSRNRYAGQPEAYRNSFRSVRRLFRQHAPEVAFAFSPALRSDLNERGWERYWPGDAYVDVVSCTWYVGSDVQFPGALTALRAYIAQAVAWGKPVAIDEMGGCDRDGGKNDHFLRRMFDTLRALGAEGVTFAHVTVFLEGKWGRDATLSWLASEPTGNIRILSPSLEARTSEH